MASQRLVPLAVPPVALWQPAPLVPVPVALRQLAPPVALVPAPVALRQLAPPVALRQQTNESSKEPPSHTANRIHTPKSQSKNGTTAVVVMVVVAEAPGDSGQSLHGLRAANCSEEKL